MAMAGVSHGWSSPNLGRPAESWGVKQREAPCGSGTHMSSRVLEGCGSDCCSITNKELSEEALGVIVVPVTWEGLLDWMCLLILLLLPV